VARCLVTGVAGFVGSHLAEALISQGHQVTGVDCFTDYYAERLKRRNIEHLVDAPRFSLLEIDLATDALEPVVAGIEFIFHEAGQPGVRGSWGQSFESYLHDNVLATQRLLEASKGLPIRRFVYASSSSVYGDIAELPISELALPQPNSPYGVTKLAAEHLGLLYWRNYGIPVVALRYFTVYGPRQRPDMAFHKFIKAAFLGEAIAVYGDGEQTRDFTYISDIIAANLAAAEAPCAGQVMNIAGGSRVSVSHVLDLVGRSVRRLLNVQHEPAQKGDVRHTFADTGRARSALGFAPEVPLEKGLQAEVAWVKELYGVD